MSNGIDLQQAEVDPTILTGSVSPDRPAGGDPERLSDENTVRNAVSSADLDGLGGKSIPWANSDTGARGAITGLVERRDGERLCRGFTASRESFDGVALFRGEACMESTGSWRLAKFEAL